MNDFEYDAMQKKRIARSARAKKGGSQSRRCRLPSDYLTESQRRKLNGECMTYQINKPITWDEFASYPVDIQKQYLEHFSEEHKCNIRMMEVMFGCKPNQFRYYVKKNRPELSGIMQSGSTKEIRSEFITWLDTQRGGAVKPAQSVTETVAEDEPEEQNTAKTEERVFTFNNCVKSGRISVSGTPNEIGVALLNIFQNQRISATISFEVEEWQKKAM